MTQSSNTTSTLARPELRLRPWSRFLKQILLPAGDWLLGQKMIERLRFLEAAQWWEPERLAAHRNRALMSLMKTAYQEVPFYRDLMDTAGLSPGDFTSPSDLSRLPIVTKTMLRSAYPHGTTRQTSCRSYEASSSGSTGANFFVTTDTETEGWYRASFLLACEWAGWRIGDPHMQTGMTLTRSRGRWLKDFILRCHYVSAYDLRDSHLDRSLEILDRNNLQHLWGYPGSLYYLAQRAIKRGWNRPLRSIITWGDNLYPHYRSTIESAFHRRVTDTYGCAEGIQVSAQCGHLNTYHLHALDVIVECLDDAGNRVPHGQPGNLILTRLHPGPMPLIRYQVGDVGTLGGDWCECGRGFDVMKSIEGRDTDVVLTPSGNRLIVHFFTGVLEHFAEIESFQVIQETLGAINLRLAPVGDLPKETEQQILMRLREKGAADLNIQVEIVDRIPLPKSGKRRFIISKISKPFNNDQQL